ncbi:unnamed protein product [Clonostachys solani]|uniref:Life-span regulatory factor domain-containing protein n=1 Tax=Clonostachys solani TaxID=160281 RepID=A0A9N9W2B2_9HYPO|nr:unnamed protein product [Clonostachys solani]
MALDLWSHQFCLACDKQVESDSAAYCSEACRLTELERTSTPNSQPSSPGMTPPSYPWTASRQRPSSGLFLSPAYDFTNAQPYGTTPPQQSMLGNYTMESHHSRSSSSGRVLTPSSSYTSLCSMHSANSATEPGQLSDGAKKELRAYAVSFEHVRTQRRRSY